MVQQARSPRSRDCSESPPPPTPRTRLRGTRPRSRRARDVPAPPPSVLLLHDERSTRRGIELVGLEAKALAERARSLAIYRREHRITVPCAIEIYVRDVEVHPPAVLSFGSPEKRSRCDMIQATVMLVGSEPLRQGVQGSCTCGSRVARGIERALSCVSRSPRASRARRAGVPGFADALVGDRGGQSSLRTVIACAASGSTRLARIITLATAWRPSVHAVCTSSVQRSPSASRMASSRVVTTA